MLLPWRPDFRVGLCPDRLVCRPAPHPVTGNPVDELRTVAGRRRTTVVVSNHFVRYAVLPWSEALRTPADWLDFARHRFAAIHGAASAEWQIRVSGGERRKARVASAIDAALLDALRSTGAVASVQPYLMAAFNSRRRSFDGNPAWFVVQEPGRLAVALLAQGEWKLARCRQVPAGWQEALPQLLERERALADAPECHDVYLWSESEAPRELGRYRISDVTLGAAGATERHLAMTLH